MVSLALTPALAVSVWLLRRGREDGRELTVTHQQV